MSQEIQGKSLDELFQEGLVKAQTGALLEAVDCFEAAHGLNPNHAPLLCNYGNVLHDLKRYDEALDKFEAALVLQPDYTLALYNRACVLQDMGQLDAALVDYEAAIAINADFLPAQQNLALLLVQLNRKEDAMRAYQQLLSIAPNDVKGLYNYVILLYQSGRDNEGILLCEKILTLDPNHTGAMHFLALSCFVNHLYERVIAYFEKIILIEPEHTEAHWNLGMSLLLEGDYKTGWAEYEWRWQNPSYRAHHSHYSQARWTGSQPLFGKTILLQAEQGLGDTLQFCRYAPLMRAMGAKVILVADPSLQTVLRSLDGVDVVLTPTDTVPDIDFYCPMMSLPLYCLTELNNMPVSSAYLHSDAGKDVWWASRLGSKKKQRVGIVWRSNAEHWIGASKSIPLAEFVQCVSSHFEFVSLQKAPTEEESLLLDALAITDPSAHLHDFSDTASLCMQMDLVITVDTSVAHLAGALGLPVWILLHTNADWRWLLNRSDSPWYQSARLFRQVESGNWGAVLQAVHVQLQIM